MKKWFFLLLLSSITSAGPVIIWNKACTSGAYNLASQACLLSGGAGSPLTNGDIWVGNASNVAVAVATSGDATISNTGHVSVSSIQGNFAAYGPGANTITLSNGSGDISVNNVTGTSAVFNNSSVDTVQVTGADDGGFATQGYLAWFSSSTGNQLGLLSGGGDGQEGGFFLYGDSTQNGRLYELDGIDRNLGGDKRAGTFALEYDVNTGSNYFIFTPGNPGNTSSNPMQIWNRDPSAGGIGNTAVSIGYPDNVSNPPSYTLDVNGVIRSVGQTIIQNASITGPTGVSIVMPANNGTLKTDPAMTSNSTSTVTFNSNKQDETQYNTSASTIGSLTLTLPASSRPGQIVRYVTHGTITSLTVSGTVDVGAALTTLAANSAVAYQADLTTGHWLRLQ